MDYADVWAIANPSRRIEALRRRSEEHQRDFLKRPPVRAMWSFDLISFPFLSDITWWRANFAKTDWWNSPGVLKPVAAYVDYRMYVVEDAGGMRIAFNPLSTDPNRIGVYQFFGDRFLVHDSVEKHLGSAGLTTGDIDMVAVDHLHLQDLVALRRLFPRARMLVQEKDLEWARNLHPVDEMFFCRGGAELDLEGLNGPMPLGESMALIPTPGHTPGHQTLVVRLPDGVATIGENGLSIDNYHPLECGVDGVADFCRRAKQEVLPIANTFWSAQAQYDSMILEKHLASPYMTYTTGALSDTRRVPAVLGRLPLPRVKRFTPRFHLGQFQLAGSRVQAGASHPA
jgi:hypothetical protein